MKNGDNNIINSFSTEKKPEKNLCSKERGTHMMPSEKRVLITALAVFLIRDQISIFQTLGALKATGKQQLDELEIPWSSLNRRTVVNWS